MADVLEVQRAQEEGRVHPRDEEASDHAGVDQAPEAKDAQRHDRVLDASLEGEEPSHQHAARPPKPSTCDEIQP